MFRIYFEQCTDLANYITLDHQGSDQVASTFKKQLYIPTSH